MAGRLADGQWVRSPVLGCEVALAPWTELHARLVGEIDPLYEVLRSDRPAANARGRTEHLGAESILDLDGPLLF